MLRIININPPIGQSNISRFLELCLFMFIIFIELLTKVYGVPFLAYMISFIYSLYFFYRYVYLKNNFIDKSMHWEKTKGKIITKQLIWKQQFLDRTVGYVPDILYKYTFNDEVYKSKQFSLADRYVTEIDKDEAQKFLNKTFKDNSVDVYVNPLNPSQSYIYQEVNSRGRFPFLGYLIVLVVPLFSFAYLLNV